MTLSSNLLAGGGVPTIINPLLKDSTYESFIYGNTGSGFLGLLLPKAIGLLLVFGSIAFFFMFLLGAISWIISGGDKAHVEAAKNRITNALIGVILMICTFAIVSLIEGFFKINILSIDIGPLVIQ